MKSTNVLLWFALCFVSCKEALPKKAESGFSMATHSMSFANFSAGYPDAVVDVAAMRRMYGDVVCRPGSSPCELTVAAKSFAANANTAMNGGRCEGFAVLASLMHSGKLSAETFGAPTARELKIEGNKPLQQELAYWFSTQLHPTVTEATVGYMAKDIMPKLAEALKGDASERYRIGMVKKVGTRISGGHAVTPISFYLEAGTKDVYVVRVYDNNHPEAERTLRIDVGKNRWEYEAAENPSKRSSLYFGDESNSNPLYLAPILARTGTLPCHFCDGSKAQVTSRGGALPVVNKLAGVIDGALKAPPGGSIAPTFSAENDFDGPDFTINTGFGDLDIDLTQGEDGTDDGAAIQVSSTGFSALVSGLNLRGAQSTFQVTQNGNNLGFQNGSRSSLTLQTSRNLNNQVLDVATRLLGGSDRVTTNFDAMGNLVFGATGAVGTPIVVSVSVGSTDGGTLSGTFSFTAQGDTSLTTNTQQFSLTGTLTGMLNNGGSMQLLTNACADNRISGMESDVDCGGTCAEKCQVGNRCTTPADCGSTFCHSTTKRCVATQCEDAVKAPNEADVDCGGTSSCGRCAAGQACTSGPDCQSGLVCAANQCRAGFLLSVNVAGLPASGSLQLTNSTNNETLDVSSNGVRWFPSRISGTYAVTVTEQPHNATCTIANGAGTATADTTLQVTCVARFAIGGTVAGLTAGSSVTLQNNGSDALTVTLNGPFSFPSRVSGAYAVTVRTAPPAQLCSVTNGSGMATADVSNVTVMCSAALMSGRDTAFGTNGLLVLPLSFGSWQAVVTNPDNSLVLAGLREPSGAPGTTEWLVSKVTATGTIDTSFGVAGHRAISVGAGLEAATSIVRDSGGRYLIAGSFEGTMDLDLGVVRLTSSGALDSTFGTNGLARFDFGGRENAHALALDGQGRVVVVGRQGSVIGGDLFVARLTPAGALDMTFATNGRYLPLGPESDSLNAVAIDASDGIIAVGERDQNSAVLKLSSGGTPVAAFGTGGLAVVDLTAGLYRDTLNAVVLDGTRIIVAGDGFDSGESNFYLAAFTSAGSLDSTFGTAGVTAIGASGVHEVLNGLVARPSGGWYAAGSSQVGPTTNAVVLAVTASGTLDTSFGTAGRFVDVYTGQPMVKAVAVDAAGQIVISGSFTDEPGVARVIP